MKNQVLHTVWLHFLVRLQGKFGVKGLKRLIRSAARVEEVLP